MKAGWNKENVFPESKEISQNDNFTSPERRAVTKVLRFEEERTPDRPIHRRIPSLVCKDYRNSLKNRIRGKKSMEIFQKAHDRKTSPYSSTLEIKSSIASTDVRGLSLFSSEVECKKEYIESKEEVFDSITEKLACERFCYRCQRYVYTKVAFSKVKDVNFLCCVKGLVSCCSTQEGVEIQHLCPKCNKLIWKIGPNSNDN